MRRGPMVQYIYRLFIHIEEYWILVVFWALGSVVFAQFFSRYVLNAPLGWTEELARHMMIAVVFLGLSVATRRGEHIAIELFVSYLPPPRRWLDVVASLLLVIGITGASSIIGPLNHKFDIRRVASRARYAFFPLLTPIIIIGGITIGVFTPTEAAVAASAYAIILSAACFAR